VAGSKKGPQGGVPPPGCPFVSIFTWGTTHLLPLLVPNKNPGFPTLSPRHPLWVLMTGSQPTPQPKINQKQPCAISGGHPTPNPRFACVWGRSFGSHKKPQPPHQQTKTFTGLLFTGGGVPVYVFSPFVGLLQPNHPTPPNPHQNQGNQIFGSHKPFPPLPRGGWRWARGGGLLGGRVG